MAPGPGGPWSATAHNFVQHQLSHAANFWRQGRPAVFHLESLSGGRAVLNLTFQLPPTAPPPNKLPPYPPSKTSNNPTFPKFPNPKTVLKTGQVT